MIMCVAVSKLKGRAMVGPEWRQSGELGEIGVYTLTIAMQCLQYINHIMRQVRKGAGAEAFSARDLTEDVVLLAGMWLVLVQLVKRMEKRHITGINTSPEKRWTMIISRNEEAVHLEVIGV